MKTNTIAIHSVKLIVLIYLLIERVWIPTLVQRNRKVMVLSSKKTKLELPEVTRNDIGFPQNPVERQKMLHEPLAK